MRLRLSNKFYKKDAVKEAIKDFKDICEGKILNGNIDIELSKKENAENLKEEFCNYVLGLMMNKGIR